MIWYSHYLFSCPHCPSLGHWGPFLLSFDPWAGLTGMVKAKSPQFASGQWGLGCERVWMCWGERRNENWQSLAPFSTEHLLLSDLGSSEISLDQSYFPAPFYSWGNWGLWKGRDLLEATPSRWGRWWVAGSSLGCQASCPYHPKPVPISPMWCLVAG